MTSGGVDDIEEGGEMEGEIKEVERECECVCKKSKRVRVVEGFWDDTKALSA